MLRRHGCALLGTLPSRDAGAIMYGVAAAIIAFLHCPRLVPEGICMPGKFVKEQNPILSDAVTSRIPDRVLGGLEQ